MSNNPSALSMLISTRICSFLYTSDIFMPPYRFFSPLSQDTSLAHLSLFSFIQSTLLCSLYSAQSTYCCWNISLISVYSALLFRWNVVLHSLSFAVFQMSSIKKEVQIRFGVYLYFRIFSGHAWKFLCLVCCYKVMLWFVDS